MSASTVMSVAILAALVGRWSHNQPTGSVKTVVESAFAIIVIALLDQGHTEPIAKGFAWLFLVAVLLSNNSPLTGLAKSFGPKAAPAAGRPAPGTAVPK